MVANEFLVKRYPAAFIILIFSILGIGPGAIQQSYSEAKAVPPKTRVLVQALDQAGWQSLETGLHAIRVITPDGLVFTAFRISPEHFDFSLALQESPKGERAKDIGEREGAVLVVNGGFFAIAESGRYFPVGYLRYGGKRFSRSWPNTGGIAVFGKSRLSILPIQQGIPDTNEDVVQSKPMMIEPGGKWAMRTDVGNSERRTLLCRMDSGDIIIGLITRSGMSLYEAGWLMREKQAGGFFGCDAAMALDGGGSTQSWYSGESQYSFAGMTPVHNFLVVRGRN